MKPRSLIWMAIAISSLGVTSACDEAGDGDANGDADGDSDGVGVGGQRPDGDGNPDGVCGDGVIMAMEDDPDCADSRYKGPP